MKRALISFSFDDGRIDNYTIVYPILKKFWIPATFNITSGYVEGKFAEGQLTHAKPMSIAMVKELYYDINCEIASHGYWHQNTFEDIIHGVEALKSDLNLSAADDMGFASPSTLLDIDYYKTIKQKLNNRGVSYVRLSKRFLSNKWMKVMARKMSRVLHLPLLFKYAYKDVLMDRIGDDLLYSAPILADTTVEEVKALVNLAIKKKKALILMLHSIVPERDVRNNFDYDVDKFETLCKWLKVKQELGCLDMVKTIDIWKQLSDGNSYE